MRNFVGDIMSQLRLIYNV